MRDNDRCRGDGEHHHDRGHIHDGSLTDLLNRSAHYFTHRIGAGLRGQESVLAQLSHNPDVTQKQLCEALGVTPASLSELLIKLERKGLVEREKDESDRRFVRVSLSEAGQAAIDEPETMRTRPFDALTSDEQEQLKILLTKLLTDWEGQYGKDSHDHGGRRCHGHVRNDDMGEQRER